MILASLCRPRESLRPLAACLCLSLLLAAPATVRSDDLFPAELVRFKPYRANPVFTAEGAGHWDARIRERGWILREDGAYHMWFTGYDGQRGRRMLGYATSPDGLKWTRYAHNPLDRDHWIEDMMVVKRGDTYYMFAEGLQDRAHLFTSQDRVHWKREGQLDVRKRNGQPIEAGPCGTPTAWFENDTWHLFYERRDLGIWLATSKDLKVWSNVQDEPVMRPGPGQYDEHLVALNQIVKHQGRYYAYYHGSSREHHPGLWTTNVAVSDDLIHWTKYRQNPLFPVEENKSSGILVHDGEQFRLYTMHNEVRVHFPADAASGNEDADRDQGGPQDQQPAADHSGVPTNLKPFVSPPAEYQNDFGDYRSPLKFYDGRDIETADDWKARRQEILETWHGIMGQWPPLIDKPKIRFGEKLQLSQHTRHAVEVEVAPEGRMVRGYLLVPHGEGPFPAVIVPYYDAETGAGMGKELRDFGFQLANRGFVALTIGTPDSRYWPNQAEAQLQPLSMLAYVAANCHTALAGLDYVDASRIGVVGHSYGGKWAMFASCLYDKFACAAWSDGGIVFDEKRANVNYWEPWYLGYESGVQRREGIPSDDNPRTGAYKTLVERGRDLHELHALMAPRPFLVSGGSEDRPERWQALNHAVAVNKLLGVRDRVAMTNRGGHSPTPESNEQLYLFFEHFLKNAPVANPDRDR